jgi:tetratricopeptide (TPR) repeat protein
MKPATRFLLAALLCAALPAGFSANQAKDDRAEVALQAAIKKETIDGDLKGAIEQYQRIAQSTNRAVAAKALLRMGQCHEKLGNAEARTAYQRLVRDFGDQAEIVAQAQVRLAALGGPGSASVSLPGHHPLPR